MTAFQTDFEWSEFASRREKIFDQIGTDAIVVLQGAGPDGVYDLFHQEKVFYYLSGIEAPQAYLVLRGEDRSTTLFLASQPVEKALDDRPLAPQDEEFIIATTGLSAVQSHAELASFLKGAKVVYTLFAPAEKELSARDVLLMQDRFGAREPFGPIVSRQMQFRTQLIGRVPTAEVRNLTPMVDELRLIKSPAELKLMRKAGRLAAKAVEEAMKVTHLGMGEYDLEAIALFVYKAGGAKNMGYKTIAPSGARIWDGHYIANTEKPQDGDLILMDGAPDVGEYTSDIGRMWPVNGRYADWQRELYGFVVRVHQETLKRIRPGVTAQQVIDEVKACLLPEWEKTTWSKPSFKEAARALLDFRGTFSHTVGLTVHDSCNYWGIPLAPGMVFTIDPQLWVRDEKIYIRVEDTVAVTENGVEILTAGPPIDLDETETLVGSKSEFCYRFGLV